MESCPVGVLGPGAKELQLKLELELELKLELVLSVKCIVLYVVVVNGL